MKCIICGSSEFKINSERFCSQECIHLYGIQQMSKKLECNICHVFISKPNFKKHLKTHEEKHYHYFCENCGKECFEKYGSCRFCSKECAKSFSTKKNRLEINKKVRSVRANPCNRLYDGVSHSLPARREGNLGRDFG